MFHNPQRLIIIIITILMIGHGIIKTQHIDTLYQVSFLNNYYKPTLHHKPPTQDKLVITRDSLIYTSVSLDSGRKAVALKEIIKYKKYNMFFNSGTFLTELLFINSSAIAASWLTNSTQTLSIILNTTFLGISLFGAYVTPASSRVIIIETKDGEIVIYASYLSRQIYRALKKIKSA